jgi:hypothetical protein
MIKTRKEILLVFGGITAVFLPKMSPLIEVTRVGYMAD